MIELNGWFFVQLANFLILVFLLNTLLFKPLLFLLRERRETIEGAVEEVKRQNEQKDKELKRYNRELADAREKAKESYQSLREEGIVKQKELISLAHKEVLREIEKAMDEIKKESERVRKQLVQDLSSFSDVVVKKLVKV